MSVPTCSPPTRRIPVDRVAVAVLLVSSVVALLFLKTPPASSADADQARDETRLTGRYAAVDWSGAPESRAEAQTASQLAERWIPEIGEIAFGRRLDPSRRIEIRLNGDARIGDPPTYRTPHVTWDGVVELYQYGASHLAALPHELVHAVLRRENVGYGRFDEEGYATYVGHVLRPSFPGFPVYGHPLDIVVGHWAGAGARIPLATLRGRHRELNLKCSFQGYALRTSFFLHLGDRFGAPAMRTFREHMGRADAYATAFGEPLDALEEVWLEATLARFAALDEGSELVDSYLAQPAVAKAYVCSPGRDF